MTDKTTAKHCLHTGKPCETPKNCLQIAGCWKYEAAGEHWAGVGLPSYTRRSAWADDGED